MSRILSLPLYRGTQVILWEVALVAILAVLSAGCVEREPYREEARSNPYLTSDTRQPIPLSPSAGKEHRAVMLQHLETIQVIVNALVEEDYELAKGLTESHLGFFLHRHLLSPTQSLARQDAPRPEAQQPGPRPPDYAELAQAHQAAVEELARIIPTKDLKLILPQFNNVLKACVACHLEYKVKSGS